MRPDLGFHSHYPVLAAAVARTTGPVLELGCGWGSTPMLRAMCRSMGRNLESMDSNPTWAEEMGVPFMTNWRQWSPGHESYGVAFIDCAPGEARAELAMRLKGKAKFILLHDAECDTMHGGGGNYRYDLITPYFRFVEFYRMLRPVTLILSNDEPFGLTKEEQTA